MDRLKSSSRKKGRVKGKERGGKGERKGDRKGEKKKGGTHHAYIAAITEDTNVPQTQLDKALIDQVHRGTNVESNGGLSRKKGG